MYNRLYFLSSNTWKFQSIAKQFEISGQNDSQGNEDVSESMNSSLATDRNAVGCAAAGGLGPALEAVD